MHDGKDDGKDDGGVLVQSKVNGVGKLLDKRPTDIAVNSRIGLRRRGDIVDGIFQRSRKPRAKPRTLRLIPVLRRDNLSLCLGSKNDSAYHASR
jgi:hypothetical protein